jgi:hypothetical protein
MKVTLSVFLVVFSMGRVRSILLIMQEMVMRTEGIVKRKETGIWNLKWRRKAGVEGKQEERTWNFLLFVVV